jgi:hypothetical protein
MNDQDSDLGSGPQAHDAAARGVTRNLAKLVADSSPSNRLQELVDRQLAASREIGRLLDPISSARSMVAKVAEESRGMTVSRLIEQQARSFASVDQFARQFAVLPTNDLAQRFAKLSESLMTEPHARFASLFEDRVHQLTLAPPPSEMQRWIADLAGGQSARMAAALAENWTLRGDSMARLLAQEGRQAALLARLAEHAAMHAEAPDSTVHDQAGATAETAQQAQQIVVAAANEPTLQATLEQILRAIENSKDTALQKVLWFVVVPMLLMLVFAVVNPLADHYVKARLTDSAQGASKGVRQRAEQAVGDVRLLADYRFVGVKNLAVTLGPRSKSPVVGRLQFGQAVLVLERRGDFARVLWTSTDGAAQVQGWVFARYLKRFS